MVDPDLGPLVELAKRLEQVANASVAIATDARPQIEAAARASAAAGQAPSGEAWAETKEGERALPEAASAIEAVVSGTSEAVVTLVLRGVYVYHHGSKGGRLPRRRILFDPANGPPPAIVNAIASSARKIIGQRMGAR